MRNRSIESPKTPSPRGETKNTETTPLHRKKPQKNPERFTINKKGKPLNNETPARTKSPSNKPTPETSKNHPKPTKKIHGIHSHGDNPHKKSLLVTNDKRYAESSIHGSAMCPKKRL